MNTELNNVSTAVTAVVANARRLALMSEAYKNVGDFSVPNTVYAVLAYTQHVEEEAGEAAPFRLYTETEAEPWEALDTPERYYDVATVEVAAPGKRPARVCIPAPMLTYQAQSQALEGGDEARGVHSRKTHEATPAETRRLAKRWDKLAAKIGQTFIADARVWALEAATEAGYVLLPQATVEQEDSALKRAVLYHDVEAAIQDGKWASASTPVLAWVRRTEEGAILPESEVLSPEETDAIIRATSWEWARQAGREFGGIDLLAALVSGSPREAQASASALACERMAARPESETVSIAATAIDLAQRSLSPYFPEYGQERMSPGDFLFWESNGGTTATHDWASTLARSLRETEER